MHRHARVPLIIAAAAVIYFTLPFVFGFAAERYSNEFLQQQNSTLGKVLGVNFSFVDYDRGWFHSSAQLQIEKNAADGSAVVIKKIPVMITHGPVYAFGRHLRTGVAEINAPEITLDGVPDYTLSFYDNIGFRLQSGALSLLPKNTTDQAPRDVRATALTLLMSSNLAANHFVFNLLGKGLHFQDPHHTFSVDVKALDATLMADYLTDRHWKMQLGMMFDKDKVSMTIPSSTQVVALTADNITVNGVHFDTEKMVKLVYQIVTIKSANDANQAVPPSAWMALTQEFLTQAITSDTSLNVKGLALTSPMGTMQFRYNASFPTLPVTHDYFDVATHDVSTMALTIPSWMYVDTAMNMEFGLNNLKLNTNSNTVFARNVNMTLGSFDIKNTAVKRQRPILNATGLSYQSESMGDPKDLSQTMTWGADQLCFSEDCFKKIHGELELSKMNFNAFRGIATATQQVVQYDPQQTEAVSTKWMNLASAYLNLVTSQTRMVLSHDMMTALGDIKLYAAVSWPDLTVATMPTPTTSPFLADAVYEVRAQFPAEYADAFLTHVASESTTEGHKAAQQKAADQGPSTEMQAADLLHYAINKGYLKKVGSAFVLDLTGKGSNASINGVQWEAPN